MNGNERQFAIDNDCLSEAELQALLEEDLLETEHMHLLAHLDQCERCCRRLEDLARGRETLDTATRCLRAPRPSRTPELQQVMRLLRTRAILAERTLCPLSQPAQWDFLSPCDTPGCIGRLEHYEVQAMIGHGGMGVVFRAFDPALHRLVAIKVLASPLAQSESARRRLQREARAVAAVRSPHVVAVYAVDETARLPYLVMEHVPGTSLQERLDADNPLTFEEIERIGRQIATGLAAAHARGIVHRDIKPANILLEEGTGAVKVTDFGLARAVDDASLTQTGTVAGTPEYMAPEQAAGEPVDCRADLFSLGSVLYAMCAGRSPFHGENTLAVLHNTRENRSPSIRGVRPDVPEWFADIVERLHRKTAAERYGSADEVLEAFSRQRAGRTERFRRLGIRAMTVLRRPCPRLAVAALILLVIGFGIAMRTGLRPTASFHEAPPRTAAAPSSLTGDSGPSCRLKVIRRLQGHMGPVSSVAVSRDGKHAVSASGWPKGDKSLRWWNLETGREVRQFETMPLVDAPQGVNRQESPGEVLSVALSPDGIHALSGRTGGLVELWNVETGKRERAFGGHTSTVCAVAFSPDGSLALSGGCDNMVRLWDVLSGKELRRLEGHRSWIRTVAFLSSGQAISGGLDATLRVWNLRTGGEIRHVQYDGWVWCACPATSGRTALVGLSPAEATGLGAVSLCDLETGQEIRRFRGHQAGVTCVAFSSDGSRAVSASYDGTVRLWDVATGREIGRGVDHREWVWTVAFHPDDRRVLSAGGGLNSQGRPLPGEDFAVRFWTVAEETTVGQAAPATPASSRSAVLHENQGH